MTIITSGLLLLDSALQPANGRIAGEVTARLTTTTGIVTKTPFLGVIKDGEIFGPDGVSALTLPATTEGEAVRVWEIISGKNRDGNESASTLARVVTIPDVATVAYSDLLDVELPPASGIWVIPPYIQTLIDETNDASAAATSAATTTTADATQVALDRIAVADHRTAVELIPGQVDGMMAAQVDPATEFGQALDATFAPRGVAGFGRYNVGYIGDSITAGADTFSVPFTGNIFISESAPTYAMITSRGGWHSLINAGVAGQRTDQMLARLQSDIINTGCNVCVILSCTWNDIGQGVTEAQSLANIEAMVSQCLSANVLPVLCTPTPEGPSVQTLARRATVSRRRRLFVKIARAYNIPVIDLMAPLIDSATGLLAPQYLAATNDIHPNPLGYRAMGVAIGAVLDRIMPGAAVQGIVDAGDTEDIMAGIGWFLTDSDADGVGNGWSKNMPAGATPSIATDPVLGKVQRVVTDASAATATIQKTGIPMIAGNRYEVSAYFTKTGTSRIQTYMQDTVRTMRLFDLKGTSPDETRAHVIMQFVAPVGVTQLSFVHLFFAGTGTVDIGQVTLRNLTAIGAA